MRAHMYGNSKNARKIPKISLMKTNQPAHKGACAGFGYITANPSYLCNDILKLVTENCILLSHIYPHMCYTPLWMLKQKINL